MTKQEIQKELAMYITAQNTRIDIAKMKGMDYCEIMDIPLKYLKKELIYYYSQMIGYVVEDDRIYFKKLKFLFSRDGDLL